MRNILTCRLLDRGDHIAIIDGKLVLEPVSGKPVIPEWLRDHRGQLVKEIVQIMNLDAFTYDGFSTGNYGKVLAGGITLQFANIIDDRGLYAIFNAHLKRDRNTAYGKKGDPLPKNHFRVGRKSRFYKFWKMSELPVPKRLSSFHDYMGSLRGLVFIGEADTDDRIRKDTISLLTVTRNQLLDIASRPQLIDSHRTNNGQESDNIQTRITDKKIQRTHVQQGVQPESSAGENKYGLSLQGDAFTSEGIVDSSIKSPQNQSVEDWLDDYNCA